MKFVGIAIIVLTIALAPTVARADPPPPDLPDAAVERALLETVDGAMREGGALKLETDAGIVTFVDRTDAKEGYAKYYLAGYHQPAHTGFYRIRVVGYEGKGFALVSKTTGQKIVLYGIPVFSPDGTRFVDVSLDLDAGHHPNFVGIYYLEDGDFILEWSHTYHGPTGPSSPVWLSDSQIVFFEVTFDNVPTAPNLKKRPVLIEFADGEWTAPRALE
jgi:hypothetical protein